MKYLKYAMILISLTGCGTPESEDSISWPPFEHNTQPDKFGLLLDNAVEGIRYISGAHYGTTNSDGSFGYIEGEDIHFYIGNIKLGHSISPTDKITPYELADGNTLATLNIARLLQTLDNDSNLDNGIQISEETHLIAKDTNISFDNTLWPDSPELEANYPDLLNTVYELTSVTDEGERGLIGKGDAYSHYSLTLDTLIDDTGNMINEIANQSTCDTNEQCIADELSTKYLFYCPPPGPLVVYSQKDIDKTLYDTLVNERDRLIQIKQNIRSVALVDNTTGFCQTWNASYSLICNDQSHCEIQY